MRRATLGHMALAFFYNTAVLALVFNLVLASLTAPYDASRRRPESLSLRLTTFDTPSDPIDTP